MRTRKQLSKSKNPLNSQRSICRNGEVSVGPDILEIFSGFFDNVVDSLTTTEKDLKRRGTVPMHFDEKQTLRNRLYNNSATTGNHNRRMSNTATTPILETIMPPKILRQKKKEKFISIPNKLEDNGCINCVPAATSKLQANRAVENSSQKQDKNPLRYKPEAADSIEQHLRGKQPAKFRSPDSKSEITLLSKHSSSNVCSLKMFESNDGSSLYNYLLRTTTPITDGCYLLMRDNENENIFIENISNENISNEEKSEVSITCNEKEELTSNKMPIESNDVLGVEREEDKPTGRARRRKKRNAAATKEKSLMVGRLRKRKR